MVVPPYVVAERMGLEIKEVHITENCSVFGQVYFSDCDVKYYDSDDRTVDVLLNYNMRQTFLL
jgi:hypothetical protein